ncbi:MAG TPA: NUDIX domain-containing protein [Candidatus Peribacteraceae bacterium]|nr:NUDIX domain-containing protein [Candidatus Peribacteraceae bacterium]
MVPLLSYSSSMSDDTYRQCAALAVFRQTDAFDETGSPVREVLLLHKPRKKDAWQLPQGGIEPGETVEQAAQRELREEAGLNVDILGRSETVYQYDFPNSYRRFRPDNVRGQQLHFVFAQLQHDQVVTVDRKEIDSHAWVLPADIQRYIGRVAYRQTVERVLEEAAKIL